jgi:regulator of RNase E activity RraB
MPVNTNPERAEFCDWLADTYPALWEKLEGEFDGQRGYYDEDEDEDEDDLDEEE